MNKKQAYELLEDVEEDLPAGRKAQCKELGNGTWVVILSIKKGQYFLWSVDDWWHYQQPATEPEEVNQHLAEVI